MQTPPFKRNGIQLPFAQLQGREVNESQGANVERVFDMNVTDNEKLIIHRIVSRVATMFAEFDAKAAAAFDGTLLAMDLVVVHRNVCPLRLLALLMCDTEDFTHDVLGIGIHLDRREGVFRNGFVPRMRIVTN